MYVFNRVYICFERGYCLSGKGLLSVWKGVIVCLERGYCLSGKGLMSVWKNIATKNSYFGKLVQPVATDILNLIISIISIRRKS